jgi:hypothetical protein
MPYALCTMHMLSSECRKQIKGFRKYLRDSRIKEFGDSGIKEFNPYNSSIPKSLNPSIIL